MSIPLPYTIPNIFILKHSYLLQLLSIPLPYTIHNLIIHKPQIIFAASVNSPAVTKTKLYHTQKLLILKLLSITLP